MRPQFREQGHNSTLFPFKMFGLWGTYRHAIVFPVNVAPAKSKMFGRAPQPTEATQGKQRLPLSIGASFQHLTGFIATDEVKPLSVGLHSDTFHFTKRIVGNQPTFDRRPEKLPRPAAMSTDCVFSQPQFEK